MKHLADAEAALKNPPEVRHSCGLPEEEHKLQGDAVWRLYEQHAAEYRSTVSNGWHTNSRFVTSPCCVKSLGCLWLLWTPYTCHVILQNGDSHFCPWVSMQRDVHPQDALYAGRWTSMSITLCRGGSLRAALYAERRASTSSTLCILCYVLLKGVFAQLWSTPSINLEGPVGMVYKTLMNVNSRVRLHAHWL